MRPLASFSNVRHSDSLWSGTSGDIRGLKVFGGGGEDLGRVDAVLEDLRTGGCLVLVGTGGFLGLPRTRFTVPARAIVGRAADAIVVDLTCEAPTAPVDTIMGGPPSRSA